MKKTLFFFSALIAGILMASCQIEEPQPDPILKKVEVNPPRNPPICGFNGLAC